MCPVLALANAELARLLVDLKVDRVETEGLLLQDNSFGESFLVGVPVVVVRGDVCTELGGQETVRPRKGAEVLKVKGTRDPLSHVCIAVAPDPIEIVLSVELDASSMSPETQFVSKRVRIGGELYSVRLNTTTERVTIRKLRKLPTQKQ
jgi:hypothetical protein